MKWLTDKQADTLDFIIEFVNLHGYPPTLREICERYKIHIKASRDRLLRIEKKGYLKFDKGQRAMKVLFDSRRRPLRLRYMVANDG